MDLDILAAMNGRDSTYLPGGLVTHWAPP